jgi:hypothetical protein
LLVVSVVHGVFVASMAQCVSRAGVMCLFACFSFSAFVVLPVHVPWGLRCAMGVLLLLLLLLLLL